MRKAAIIEDPVRTLVAERLAKGRLDMSEVSKSLGKNHAYLHQFLKVGKPQKLPEDVRKGLASLLGVPEDSLRHGPATVLNLTTPHPRSNATFGQALDWNATGELIPLYGQAIGGKDGRFVLNGERLADILAPPTLRGVRDAYAVSVVGESMEPRYQAGETVYVHPRKPVRSGDYVVIQILGQEGDPPSGYVKRFISMDEKRLRVRQLNPDAELQFPTKDVVAVHKIVLGGE